VHIPTDTKSVTKILKEVNLPPQGQADMFESETNILQLNEGLKGKGITEDTELGNFLHYIIEKYLEDEKNFKLLVTPKKEYQYDSNFGKTAWALLESKCKMDTKDERLLEQPLVGYGVNGIADCIIQREGQPTIIIDFKWTAVNYQNPSPGYALQLLLYQWMEGQQYGEEEGAELYLIRFCEDINTMQLIPFIPEEGIQYSSANASKVKSYKDICDAFCEAYGYRGPKSVDELSTKMYEKLTVK
jgi:hypothetical protein